MLQGIKNNLNYKNMANWARTSYRIEGSESDLKRVFDVIDSFMTDKCKPAEENASKEWEGNIVRALGATDEQMEIRCSPWFHPRV